MAKNVHKKVKTTEMSRNRIRNIREYFKSLNKVNDIPINKYSKIDNDEYNDDSENVATKTKETEVVRKVCF